MLKIFRDNTLCGAAVIGVAGGLIALAYYFVLQAALHWVWQWGLGVSYLKLFHGTPNHLGLVAITVIGGALVGCCIKWLGSPGEIAAVVNNIHLERGRLDPKQSPSMIANSLVSITTGGSAGPEAPLVQIIGSFGSWFGERLRLSDEKIRIFTFCGMATALGAFFGSPIGGALFALEIPHRKGLEYYEALVPSCIAAVIGFLVFRSVLGWDRPMYAVPTIHQFSYLLLCFALALGVAGAFIGGLFAYLFQTLHHIVHPLAKYPILLGALGGLLIGVSAVFFPETLFWGEHQIPSLLTLPATPLLFVTIALIKALTIGFTLHFGFRGGFIFPLFFIGASLGMALSIVLPVIPPAVAVLCLMAAVNVAVTKTPISTTIILTALSGASVLPILAITSFTSFLVSSRVSVIESQRSRIGQSSTSAAANY
jgi:H+/Cl- antiporter ClcA